MLFDAIVHAPELRIGTRVNIARADQSLDRPAERLALGSEVQIRFGVCCPDKARGMIVEHSSEPEIAVLAIGTQAWPLRKGVGGVTTGGLLSEYWYVTEP